MGPSHERQGSSSCMSPKKTTERQSEHPHIMNNKACSTGCLKDLAAREPYHHLAKQAVRCCTAPGLHGCMQLCPHGQRFCCSVVAACWPQVLSTQGAQHSGEDWPGPVNDTTALQQRQCSQHAIAAHLGLTPRLRQSSTCMVRPPLKATCVGLNSVSMHPSISASVSS